MDLAAEAAAGAQIANNFLGRIAAWIFNASSKSFT
jgi:hypothetical protein